MSRDDDDVLINPLDNILDQDFGPVPVGGNSEVIPTGGFFDTEPLPAASEENFICLRGPCKFYMETTVRFNAGNTAGTLDHDPVLVRRGCMRISGYEIDLTDENVVDCSEWYPRSKDENKALKKARAQYTKTAKYLKVIK